MINQQVQVGDTLSSFFGQVEGVPQDNILIVLCFVLAINDIVTAVPDVVSCSLYVDDCCLRAYWILTFWSSNSLMPLLGLFLMFIFVYSCRIWLKLPTPLLGYVVLL